MINKTDIEKVLLKYPTLSYSGFGVNDKDTFFNHLDEIQYVCDILQKVGKTKIINKNISSYGFKHWVETKNNYVANGTFILAALMLGFDIVISAPNAYFNISIKDLKKELT